MARENEDQVERMRFAWLKVRFLAEMRPLSLATTFALYPAAFILARSRSLVALIYAAAILSTCAYHATAERHFRRIDHACAYGVISANVWMVIHSGDWLRACLGSVFVAVALGFYRRAHVARPAYDAYHALWHLASGFAGYLFAASYLMRASR